MDKIEVGTLNFQKMQFYNIGDEFRSCDIFVFNNKMYKLFQKNYKFNSELLTTKLDCLKKNSNLKKCVRPNNYLTFINSVIGYEMDFFSKYKSFAQTLNDNSIDTNLRKQLSKFTILELKEMHDNKFVHTDFHTGNIITDKNDILFIDPDSFVPGILLSEKRLNFEKLYDIKHSAMVVLSYIYKIDFMSLDESYLIEIIEELNIDPELRDYVLATIFKDKSIENTYVDQFIDNIDNDKVKYDEKHVLLKYR